ncbi:MAG: hypothetical protein E7254_07865 [Lachnospiraceae bacterium]|nr:hypothetical protein [Lachnospiraceae bacterium]
MFYYNDFVKYSEVDDKGELPLYGILEYFQNCINIHSLDINKDFMSMNELGKAWVLLSWKIKIYKKVKLYDRVTVGTWSYGYDKVYGYRNYILKDEQGEVLACADTKWILIDLETRMPKRIEPEDLAGYATGDKLDLGKSPRKIKLSEDRTEMEPVKVLRSYIDTNKHMNNTAYFRLAWEYIPEDLEFDTIDAVYNKETTQGMTIIPVIHKEEKGMGISFEGADGTVYMTIKLYQE